MSLDRQNVTEAEMAMARLCPEINARRAWANLAIRCIAVAKSIANESWAITLFPYGIRLNVGQVAVLELWSGLAVVYCVAPLALIPSEQIYPQSDWRAYRAVSSSTERWKVATDLLRSLPGEIVDGNLALVRMAASAKRATPFRRSHSPGILAHLESLASEAGVVEEMESSDILVTESPSETSRDSTPSFTHAEVCPLVAGLILRAAKQSEAFVTHDALVSMVLDDKRGAEIVSRARIKSSWPDDRSAASNMVAWFSQQISVGRSEWADFFVRERIEGAWAYRLAAAATPGKIPDADFSAIEGEPRMFLHLRRERDRSLVAAKHASARNSLGQLVCEVCGFVAELAYPGICGGLCEIHHRRALSELVEPTETRLDDLAVLCPNCHRAIHQTEPMLTVEEFRRRLCETRGILGGA